MFKSFQADPSGRAVYGGRLRPLACWDCGFEYRRRHGCLSVVCIVCCQVESLRRVDHSSRGVLPTVVRCCVWSWILEALAHWGLLRHGKKNSSNITPRTKVWRAEMKWRRGNVNTSLGQGANAISRRNPVTDCRWAYPKGFNAKILVFISPIIYTKTNNTQSCPCPLHSGRQAGRQAGRQGEWKYSSTDSLLPH